MASSSLFNALYGSSGSQNPATDDVTNGVANLGMPSRGRSRRNRRSRQRPLRPDAVQLLSTITGLPNNHISSCLFKAEILDVANDNHQKIVEYIKNSQEHGFGIKVTNVIRIIRNNDRDFDEDRTTKRFRMMLWHGTKKICVSSILQKGFERPANKSQMFGLGIYFADRASKSARYCDGTSPNAKGYMFLCDVDLGHKIYKSKNAHTEYTEPPTGFDTVKCVGANIPNWEMNKKIGGSLLPSGPTVKNTRFPSYTVVFNEYVVYHTERIKPKFLVEVQFQPQKCV